MDLHLTQSFLAEFVTGAARIASSALVAGLWQGLLLCAATGALLQALPRSTAKLRFVVWSAVFCVSVALPFANLARELPAGLQTGSTPPHWTIDPRWSYLVALFWLAFAAYRAGELLLQGFGLRRLWKSATPVPEEALTGLEVRPAAAGRKVEICTSSEVDRPSVIGFFAPRILIPEWLLAELTATELNHIVLHEMEHLRRRDDWVNLLQKIGLTLLPLNPALFWIDRRLSTERELACDDGVLERTKAPRAYAASLASVAERRLGARRSSRLGALALAATGQLRRRSELGQRIESILGRRVPASPIFAGGMAALMVAGILAAAAGLVRTPQLVSFGAGESARAAAVSVPPLLGATSGAFAAVARGRTISFQNVSFQQPGKSAAPRPKLAVRGLTRPVSTPEISTRIAIPPAPPRQFVVLTTWEDSPVTRVVIATPDGRFLVAPYAAVPTQAGWLIVQL